MSIGTGRWMTLGGPVAAVEDPNTWEQRDWEREQWEEEWGATEEALLARVKGARQRLFTPDLPSADKLHGFARQLPPPPNYADNGPHLRVTPWEVCCDDKVCAYAVEYMGGSEVRGYRINYGEEESRGGEGWLQVFHHEYESFGEGPYDLDDDALWERGIKTGVFTEEEVPWGDFTREAWIESLDEPSEEEIAAEIAWQVEDALEDIWQFDPACD